MSYRARPEIFSLLLTEQEVRELIELRRMGVTLSQLANQFNVHENTVRNILRRVEIYEQERGVSV